MGDSGTSIAAIGLALVAFAAGPLEMAVAQPPAVQSDEVVPRDVYEYDVEVTIAEAVRTWVRGKLQVIRDVTNAPVEVLALRGSHDVIDVELGPQELAA